MTTQEIEKLREELNEERDLETILKTDFQFHISGSNRIFYVTDSMREKIRNVAKERIKEIKEYRDSFSQ